MGWEVEVAPSRPVLRDFGDRKASEMAFCETHGAAIQGGQILPQTPLSA